MVQSRMTKYCPRCTVTKPVAEFYKAKGRRDGLSVYCVVCSRLVEKESALALRSAVIAHLGGACVKCGYCADSRALQIDHVNGDGRTERKTSWPRQWMRSVLNDTSGRYQLLCANCNIIKRIEQQEHGARVYAREIPTERIIRDNQRWTPEARSAQAALASDRWKNDTIYRSNTVQAQSDSMRRRWASGEIPNRRST